MLTSQRRYAEQKNQNTDVWILQKCFHERFRDRPTNSQDTEGQWLPASSGGLGGGVQRSLWGCGHVLGLGWGAVSTDKTLKANAL